MVGKEEVTPQLIDDDGGRPACGSDEDHMSNSWLGTALAAAITAGLVSVGTFAVSNTEKPIVTLLVVVFYLGTLLAIPVPIQNLCCTPTYSLSK